MTSIILLATATFLYAGYNVFVKASGNAVPESAETIVLATVTLQLSALTTSGIFAAVLWNRGVENFSLSTPTFAWAILAGLCIGGAEIAYFYLFGGLDGREQMSASIAIPVIVAGTIVIALFASAVFFGETIAWQQVVGALLIAAGIAVLFHGKTTAGVSH